MTTAPTAAPVSAAAKMPWGMIALDAGLALLLLWLYGGDAIDASKASTARAAAYAVTPSIALPIVALVATLACAAIAALGVAKKRGADFKGYRLLPIAAVVVFFIDLLVVQGSQVPISSADRTQLAMQALANKIQEASGEAAVYSDPGAIQQWLGGLDTPPYLVDGQPARAWSLSVHKDCDGPVLDAGGAPLGTFFFCRSKDAKTAWLTVVTMNAAHKVGEPQIFTRRGEPMVISVHARVPEPAEGDSNAFWPGGEDFTFEGPKADGGN